MPLSSEQETPFFIYILDLFGTGAFAFSGALRVVDRRPDFVGMLILATATAIGGGIFRDVVLNRDPVALHNIGYPLVILFSTFVTFFFPASVLKRTTLFKYFDAVGLGAFTAFTAQIAWNMQLNPFALITLAGISGCAGGVIRDVIVQKPTIILENDLYVTPAVLGSLGLMIVLLLEGNHYFAAAVAFFATTGLRTASIIWDIRLPRLLWVHTENNNNQ